MMKMSREFISKNSRVYELMYNENYDITTVLEMTYEESEESIFADQEVLQINLVNYCCGNFADVENMKFIINMIEEYENNK